MHVEQQFTDIGIFKAELLRQYQCAAWAQTAVNLFQQAQAVGGFEELQGKVQELPSRRFRC
jgi:hypothetical protein